MANRKNISASANGRRLLWISLSAVFLSSACTNRPAAPSGADGRAVHMSLTNRGTEALHCHLVFGHWVERDLDLIAPGSRVDMEVLQATTDGALYVMRADGQRRMMIETIRCGREGDWMASFGQVDLAPARARRPEGIAASCAVPGDHGRVACDTALDDKQSGS